MFKFCLALVLLCFILLTTDSRDPVEALCPDTPFRKAIEVPDPPVMVSLCRRRPKNSLSPLFIPLKPACLSREVLLLYLRLYSRFIPLWGVRYTSPTGVRLLAELDGGLCSAFWEDCTTTPLKHFVFYVDCSDFEVLAIMFVVISMYLKTSMPSVSYGSTYLHFQCVTSLLLSVPFVKQNGQYWI